MLQKQVLKGIFGLEPGDWSADILFQFFNVVVHTVKFKPRMLPEDLREEEYEDEEPEEIEEDELLAEADIYVDDYCPPPKRPGFFATLFGVIAGIDMASGSNQHRHNGRCNGDCAHCPPHYGYRYGRWYYGHNHVHGCEFGGNKGSGSMD